MNKKDLFNKLSKLDVKTINKSGFEKDEIEYLKTLILNQKIGLKLDFQEQDEKLKQNYMLLEEDESLGINVKSNEPNHLLIEGDNYYALKALLAANVKVDVIYIDPPYNTGKEFVYNDQYGIKKIVGQDDPHRHSKWLSFMKRRLILAKKILANDGIIFISIDDNEQAYLKVLMDEIFGERNFISSSPRKTSSHIRLNTKNELQKLHDYILIYSKYKNDIQIKQEIIGEKTFKYKDEIGEYDLRPMQNSGADGMRKYRPNLYFPIYVKNDQISIDEFQGSIAILPSTVKGQDGRWLWSKEKIMKDKKFIVLKNGKLFRKVYKKDEDNLKYRIFDTWIGNFKNTMGSRSLASLSMQGIFEYPKPIELMKYLINFSLNENCIVLDFFAGSGTTAQAVMELNKEDGGNRRFILITNNEREGFDTTKNPELGIAQAITRERIFRVINGVGSKGEEFEWRYSKEIKSLTNNSMSYLRVKLIDKVNGDFEEIDHTKKLFKKEFNHEISIIDLHKEEA